MIIQFNPYLLKMIDTVKVYTMYDYRIRTYTTSKGT